MNSKGKKTCVLLLLTSLITVLSSFDFKESEMFNTSLTKNKSGIVLHREPWSKENLFEKMKELPKYDPTSEQMWQVDLRNKDLSKVNIKTRINDLLFATFDTSTKWPKDMPEDFSPDKIMELGKNPGLFIKKLHQNGINGKGVSIAILDQGLLVDHEEYKDRIKLYEEIHCAQETSMHGSAVTSIAVGKNIGVAPEADLYYIGGFNGNIVKDKFEYDFTYLAKSIDRIIEVNNSLPKEKKIRVISTSFGWDVSQKGYKEITAAVERAKKAGIFVVSSSLEGTYGFKFQGLGRNIMLDPDKASSYTPGLFWKKYFYSEKLQLKDTLLIPMDSRCTAAPNGCDSYVFYSEGGWSWSIPYIAGLYTLACQVNPDITPDKFWNAALKTGDTIEIKNDNKIYKFGKIVNPQKLMESIKK